MGNTREDTFPCSSTFSFSFTFPFSSRLVKTALENFLYPQDVQTSVFLLICLLLLNMFQVVFKQLFKNITQRSPPRLDSNEWQGMGDSMSKYLGQCKPPVFQNFTSEQVEKTEYLVKCLEKLCYHPDHSRETQITATCWGLAQANQALLNTTQHPRGENKVSGSDEKTTGIAATPSPTTCTRATPTPATCTTATPSPLTGTWLLQPQ